MPVPVGACVVMSFEFLVLMDGRNNTGQRTGQEEGDIEIRTRYTGGHSR
jgi:hypothetical protein